MASYRAGRARTCPHGCSAAGSPGELPDPHPHGSTPPRVLHPTRSDLDHARLYHCRAHDTRARPDRQRALGVGRAGTRPRAAGCPRGRADGTCGRCPHAHHPGPLRRAVPRRRGARRRLERPHPARGRGGADVPRQLPGRRGARGPGRRGRAGAGPPRAQRRAGPGAQRRGGRPDGRSVRGPRDAERRDLGAGPHRPAQPAAVGHVHLPAPRAPGSPRTSSTSGVRATHNEFAARVRRATARSATAGGPATATATAPTSPAPSAAPGTAWPRTPIGSGAGARLRGRRHSVRACSPAWTGPCATTPRAPGRGQPQPRRRRQHLDAAVRAVDRGRA